MTLTDNAQALAAAANRLLKGVYQTEGARRDQRMRDIVVVADAYLASLATTPPESPSLREAAQAVVDRWETPLWKDVPSTASFIYRLRDALATTTAGGGAATEDDIAMAWNTVRAEARATACGRGMGELLKAVEQYAQRCVAHATHPAPATEKQGEVPACNAAFGDPRRAMNETELQEFCIALSFEQDDYTEEVIRAVEGRMLAKPLFVRTGYAQVPLHLTPEMQRVLDEEGWQWEDLLAAVDAITEAEYAEIASPTPTTGVTFPSDKLVWRLIEARQSAHDLKETVELNAAMFGLAEDIMGATLPATPTGAGAQLQGAAITPAEQAAWHAGLDEGRRQGRASAEIERADE